MNINNNLPTDVNVWRAAFERYAYLVSLQFPRRSFTKNNRPVIIKYPNEDEDYIFQSCCKGLRTNSTIAYYRHIHTIKHLSKRFKVKESDIKNILQVLIDHNAFLGTNLYYALRRLLHSNISEITEDTLFEGLL